MEERGDKIGNEKAEYFDTSVSWNTNTSVESLETQTRPKNILTHIRLHWKDQRMPKASDQRPAFDRTSEFPGNDKGFQFIEKFRGTLLEIWKWRNGCADKGLVCWLEHLWTNCRQDSPRPILTHRQCVARAVCYVQCAVCSVQCAVQCAVLWTKQ